MMFYVGCLLRVKKQNFKKYLYSALCGLQTAQSALQNSQKHIENYLMKYLKCTNNDMKF